MDNEFKSLILVAHKRQLMDAFRLYDRLLFVGKCPLILTDYGIELENKKYSYRSMYDYQKKFKINHSALWQAQYNLTQRLAEQKMPLGETLRRLTNYKDVSLWDLSIPFIFSKLKPILYDIIITDVILDFEKPREVYIINGINKLEQIFCLLCKKKNINFSIEYPKNNDYFLWAKKVCRECLFFIKRTKRLFLSLYFLIINFLKFPRLNKRFEILFFAPIERFFISMLPVIQKYKDDKRLVINLFPFDNFKKLIKNKIFYLDFYGFKIYSLFYWKNRNFLKRIKDSIFCDDALFSNILYKGVIIGSLLNDMFEGLIYEEFPEKIRYVDIVRKIFSAFKPKVIVVTDNSFEFSLIAKSLSKTVVALQTGHVEEFISRGPVVADALTVDGNYWKDYLVKRGVNANKIYVTGITQLDILENKNFSQENNQLSQFYKSKKRVIFADGHSQSGIGITSYEWIEQIRLVCNAMKNISDAHLIIKPHPYSKDPGIYKTIAEEMGLSIYTIVKNIDMLSLLCSCDLLIANYSKACCDAIMMDKDVISLYYSSTYHYNDVWDFEKFNPVIAIDKTSELESYIRKVLFDPQIKSMLKKNREVYIREHVYKIDGKSSERVKEVIDNFCIDNHRTILIKS